ncbi:MAG: leucyl aminopeptidase [SAR324 cluster bacterium]|nr:leucyl aminopeptidase [SAR324 cluster bacterium]
MNITFAYKTQAVDNTKTECLVVFLPKDTNKDAGYLDQLPKSFHRLLKKFLKLGGFSGKAGQIELAFTNSSHIPRILLAGLGEPAEVDAEKLRRVAGQIGKKIVDMKIANIAVLPPAYLQKNLASQTATLIAEGIGLGAYTFDQYKTKEKNDDSGQEPSSITVTLYDPKKVTEKKALDLGKVKAETANYARTLGNTPSNDMTPTVLAQHAEALAKKHNLICNVLEESDMEALGMHMLLGVSRGSREPAKLIIMEYKHKKAKDTLAIVGKGVTFDSGGISLKPSTSMEEMKFDMCGAAAVMATMDAIGVLRPKLNIITVIPTSENLPGGTAQRPGDIVTSYSGKKVEIINTDAEGRLILGDALAYVAKKFNPDAIIDLATLTGACVVALGKYASGAITNDDVLCEKVVEAGKSSGEPVWPLPNFPEYGEAIKGKYSDLKNVGGRDAGTITAGLFLKNFVGDIPWVHLDIAGTAWAVKEIGHIPNSGATGVGVRLLTDLIHNWKA